MKCVNHQEKDAQATCNHCGKSICSDCLFELKGESYCKDCIIVKQGGVKKEERSPALAAILSFVIAGLGQFYNGQPGKGLLIFLTSILIVPWIIGIFDAYNTAKKINRGEIIVKKQTGCLIAFVVTIVISWIMVFFIALLAAIAIPNLLRARLNANEAAVQATLKNMSTALEAYAAEHNGQFPSSESEFFNSSSAQGFKKEAVSGYALSFVLQPDEYKIIAVPKDCNISGVKEFTVEKGGVFSVSECKAKND